MARRRKFDASDFTKSDGSPDILDDDIVVDEWPDAEESRAILAEMDRDQYWPNVWLVNERGNVDLLRLTLRGARSLASWV